MAQPGQTTIQLYSTTTTATTPSPSNLISGELALNLTDKKVFTKDSSGNVIEMTPSPTNALAVGSGGTGATSAASARANLDALAAANPSYTGTLTGGTGVVNLGSGQFVKDASGNVMLGGTPDAWYTVSKALQVASLGFEGRVGTAYSGIYTNAYIDAAGNNYIYKANGYATWYRSSNGSHSWHTAPSGTAGNPISFTQAMTLDASGNLGLGVTPSAWASGYKALELTGGAFVGISTSIFDTPQNAYYQISGGYTYKTTNPASMYRQSAGAHTWYTSPSGTAGNPISFTQAMTLDASGNLLVGATSAALTDSDSFVFAKTGKYGAFQHSTGTVYSSRYLYFAYAGAEIGSITQNGTTATSFNTTSDHRLKTNVRPSDARRFTDIQFRDFEWVDGRHDCGVIAHELQAIYPDLVFGEKDATEEVEYEISPTVPAVLDDEGNEVTPAVEAVIGTKTQPKYQQVNYTGLIARMGTVVQRHEKTIETMQAQLDEQNTAMQLLASRLAALEAA